MSVKTDLEPTKDSGLRKQLLAVHAEFSGDILKEILREIDPGLTKDELRRLIKIKLRKIGIDIPLESIKIPGKINLTGTKSKKPPIQNAESVC